MLKNSSERRKKELFSANRLISSNKITENTGKQQVRPYYLTAIKPLITKPYLFPFILVYTSI